MTDPVHLTSPIDLWLLDLGLRYGIAVCVALVVCLAAAVGYAVGRRRNA